MRLNRGILSVVVLASSGLAARHVSAAAAEERLVLDRIVAVVGDDLVLLSDLERATTRHPLLQEMLASLPKNADARLVEQRFRAVEARVLDELVDAALLRAEARKYDIRVTDEDVERAAVDVARQYGMSLEELRKQVEASEEYGSWAEYTGELRDQILQIKVPSYLLSWSVSEAQVREHYRKLTRDETAKVEVVQFTFVPSSETSADRDRASANAQAWARRLREGADALSLEASVGTTQTRTIGRGDIAPALEDAIFAGKSGDVIGPLPTGQGFSVFSVVDRQESAALSYEEAKDRIRADLENEAFMKARTEQREQLRAKAHIDIRL